MMLVRILRDADLPTHLVKAGQIFEVDERYGKGWIEQGIAELYVEPKEKAIERKPKEKRAQD